MGINRAGKKKKKNDVSLPYSEQRGPRMLYAVPVTQNVANSPERYVYGVRQLEGGSLVSGIVLLPVLNHVKKKSAIKRIKTTKKMNHVRKRQSRGNQNKGEGRDVKNLSASEVQNTDHG